MRPGANMSGASTCGYGAGILFACGLQPRAINIISSMSLENSSTLSTGISFFRSAKSHKGPARDMRTIVANPTITKRAAARLMLEESPDGSASLIRNDTNTPITSAAYARSVNVLRASRRSSKNRWASSCTKPRASGVRPVWATNFRLIRSTCSMALPRSSSAFYV